MRIGNNKNSITRCAVAEIKGRQPDLALVYFTSDVCVRAPSLHHERAALYWGNKICRYTRGKKQNKKRSPQKTWCAPPALGCVKFALGVFFRRFQIMKILTRHRGLPFQWQIIPSVAAASHFYTYIYTQMTLAIKSLIMRKNNKCFCASAFPFQIILFESLANCIRTESVVRQSIAHSQQLIKSPNWGRGCLFFSASIH